MGAEPGAETRTVMRSLVWPERTRMDVLLALATGPSLRLLLRRRLVVVGCRMAPPATGEKTLRSRLIHPVDGWVSSKLLVKACLLKGYLGRRAAGLGKALELCFMEGGELITITVSGAPTPGVAYTGIGLAWFS